MVSKRKKKLSDKEVKSQKRKELFKELLPLGKSFTLWILLVVIVAWDYTNHQWFSMAFVHYTTHLSIWISKLFFIPARIIGEGVGTITTIEVNYISVSINNFPMIIELECSAYHAYLAILALTVFSPWKLKHKFIGGGIIFASLSAINSLRIVGLGIIGRKYPQIFDLMHDYVWNILLVIIIWGLWELANKIIAKQNEKIPA